MTTRTRLTLWYAAVLSIVLLIFSLVVYAELREALYATLDESLENRTRDLAGLINVRHGPFPGMVPDPNDQYVHVYDAKGRLTFSTPKTASYRITRMPLADGGTLEVGLEDEEIEELLHELSLILLTTIPVALLASVLGGAFMAGRALRPIDDLAQLAQRITAEDLSQRLKVTTPNDEIGRLARTMNEMIARLEKDFGRQRQFTGDASHELRTPLTALKAQLEVALQKERTPREYQDALASMGEQVERMIRMVGCLLMLARAESGQLALTREDLNARELLSGAVEQMRPLAEEKGASLELEAGPPTLIRGDEDMLLQLVLNLLHNAISATAAGGRITAGWSAGELWVRDTGTGIAAEHLPHIFERFYRVNKTRSREDGGTGLGLAISTWIAEAHGGTLRAESQLGHGTTFRLRLRS